MMVDLYTVAFWLSIIGVCIAGFLGLLGTWVKEFWKNDVGIKLIITDVIITVTAVAVTAITFFLRE